MEEMCLPLLPGQVKEDAVRDVDSELPVPGEMDCETLQPACFVTCGGYVVNSFSRKGEQERTEVHIKGRWYVDSEEAVLGVQGFHGVHQRESFVDIIARYCPGILVSQRYMHPVIEIEVHQQAEDLRVDSFPLSVFHASKVPILEGKSNWCYILSVRRKDREITDWQDIISIVQEALVCRLAFQTDDAPYIVPLSYGYEVKDGKLVLYFHGAREGRKIDLIREGRAVGFELDTGYSILSGEKACDYTMDYRSVVGTGHVELIEDVEGKRYALNRLMDHYTQKSQWEYPDIMMKRTGAFRMVADTISAKEKK